jgi:hypothetical protein
LRNWQSFHLSVQCAACGGPIIGRKYTYVWDCRLAAASILAIAVLVARAQAQDSSFMDMNMNMGCMLMAGLHEMQVSVYQTELY